MALEMSIELDSACQAASAPEIPKFGQSYCWILRTSSMESGPNRLSLQQITSASLDIVHW